MGLIVALFSAIRYIWAYILVFFSNIKGFLILHVYYMYIIFVKNIFLILVFRRLIWLRFGSIAFNVHTLFNTFFDDFESVSN